MTLQVFADRWGPRGPRLRTSKPWLGALVLGALLGGVGLRQAAADGVPSAPLTYGGYLEDLQGQPASGDFAFAASVYEAPTGGAPLCSTTATVPVSRGWFSLPLGAACTDTFRAGTNRYLELSVGGATLPRQPVGAVPYALEAGRASAAGGPLQAELAAMKAAFASSQAELATSRAEVAALSTKLGGAQIFNKSGNNGSVACATFCADAKWAGVAGVCLGARRKATGEYLPCASVPGQEVECLCAAF